LKAFKNALLLSFSPQHYYIIIDAEEKKCSGNRGKLDIALSNFYRLKIETNTSI